MSKLSYFILLIVALQLFSLKTAYAGKVLTAKPCGCKVGPEYKPVCGSNRVTYLNEQTIQCENECKNMDIKVVHDGFCRNEETSTEQIE